MKYLLAILVLSFQVIAFANAEELTSLSPDITQAVIVDVPDLNAMTVSVSLWEKNNEQWVKQLGPWAAVIGRNGLAAPDQKREGDGKTPSGIYNLRRSFGYEKEMPTQLEYRQVTENDKWIDDVNSPQYNQWVTGETEAKSFETLRRPDDLYKEAIVIEYNTDPVVSGLGSAIFMHIWRGEDKPTAGCVALEESHLLKILKWLDPKQNPVVILQSNKKEK